MTPGHFVELFREARASAILRTDIAEAVTVTIARNTDARRDGQTIAEENKGPRRLGERTVG